MLCCSRSNVFGRLLFGFWFLAFRSFAIRPLAQWSSLFGPRSSGASLSRRINHRVRCGCVVALHPSARRSVALGQILRSLAFRSVALPACLQSLCIQVIVALLLFRSQQKILVSRSSDALLFRYIVLLTRPWLLCILVPVTLSLAAKRSLVSSS